MDKYPTPTLDRINELKKSDDWIAKGKDTVDPTSLDEKMWRFLLLGSLELIGSQLFEINKSLNAQKTVPLADNPKEDASQKVILPTLPVSPTIIKEEITPKSKKPSASKRK
jgi:hypothetical protein